MARKTMTPDQKKAVGARLAAGRKAAQAKRVGMTPAPQPPSHPSIAQLPADPAFAPVELKTAPTIDPREAQRAQATWLAIENGAVPMGHTMPPEVDVKTITEPTRQTGDGFRAGESVSDRLNPEGPTDADFERQASELRRAQVKQANAGEVDAAGHVPPSVIRESPRVAWARERMHAKPVSKGGKPRTPEAIVRKLLTQVQAQLGSGMATKEFCSLCENKGIHGVNRACECVCHDAWEFVAWADGGDEQATG